MIKHPLTHEEQKLYNKFRREQSDKLENTKDLETEKHGWWSVKFELTLEKETVCFEDLTEVTQEYICKLISEGFTSGEICE